MDRPRVIIIGGGFSGTALALELVRADARVAMVERRGRFGPGLAYATVNPRHLLNVRAERMSFLPDAPEDFYQWLRERGDDLSGDAYAPRALYGEYLSDRLQLAKQFAPEGALEFIPETAISCRADQAGASAALASGATLVGDVIVLALGNLAPLIPFDGAAALPNGVYVHDPWDAAAIASIAPSEDVLLLGAGLTMYDAVLGLARTPRAGRLHALSRHGLTPRPQWDDALADAEHLDPPLALSEALAFARKRAAALQARGEPWQNVMNSLRVQAQGLWQCLPAESQARFLRHLRPWWDVHRHRAAPRVVASIEALRYEGALTVHAGRILEVKPGAKGARVTWRPRGAGALQTLDVARIVNCTGANARIAASTEPLVQQLLRDGVARPHATGFGFDVDRRGALRRLDGAVHTRLFALGPLTQGAFWETTAVSEIREAAATLARLLADSG